MPAQPVKVRIDYIRDGRTDRYCLPLHIGAGGSLLEQMEAHLETYRADPAGLPPCFSRPRRSTAGNWRRSLPPSSGRAWRTCPMGPCNTSSAIVTFPNWNSSCRARPLSCRRASGHRLKKRRQRPSSACAGRRTGPLPRKSAQLRRSRGRRTRSRPAGRQRRVERYAAPTAGRGRREPPAVGEGQNPPTETGSRPDGPSAQRSGLPQSDERRRL